MVWTSANGPKCPVSPEDRGEEPTIRTASEIEQERLARKRAATPSKFIEGWMTDQYAAGAKPPVADPLQQKEKLADKLAEISGRMSSEYDRYTIIKAVAALRSSPQPTAVREQIAAIIEDNIYRKHNGNWDGDAADLLVAADAILAALALSRPHCETPE